MTTSSAEEERDPPADNCGRIFYRIDERPDGLVDVLLTPAEVWATRNGLDYRMTVLAVPGIDPKDPQWRGDLEGEIRRNYQAWVESGEVMELWPR